LVHGSGIAAATRAPVVDSKHEPVLRAPAPTLAGASGLAPTPGRWNALRRDDAGCVVRMSRRAA
jgi:hypothetical protein